MRYRQGRWGMIVAGVLLFVLVMSELVLPRLISSAIAQGMKGALGSDNVVVTARNHPAAMMLTGNFSQFSADATDAKVDKMNFSVMHAELHDVQLDMSELLVRHVLVVKSVQDVDLSGTVTQEELARILNQSVKGVRNATVTVTPDRVQVSSHFVIGGIASLSVMLEGKIVADKQKIKFVTERFYLNNNLVGNIAGGMLSEFTLADLKQLPFDVTVRDIVMENGKVTVNADNKPR